MSLLPAGTRVEYTITHLEMTERPEGAPRALPGDLRLEAAERPPVWFFLALYGAVGRDYEWTDHFQTDPDVLRAFLHHPDVTLFTAYRHGWPAGFFLLDWREAGTCDLGYFGLVPQAVGTGIGGAFLSTAIHKGWSRAGVARMTLNTCTLDHPRALSTYCKAGFRPVRLETQSRVLARDRDLSTQPFAEPADV